MSVKKLVNFLLILFVIVLFIILAILIDILTFPSRPIMTTTVAIAPTTTTTIRETTTTTTTTTRPVIIHKSYCKNNKCWLYEGESLDVVEDDIEYLVTLKGVVDDDTAVIDVDGESEMFNQGEDRRVKGLGIYLMEVFYLPKEGQVSFVQIQLY